MNIERLRQVQASIADTSKPFNMAHWNTCIAAHSQSVRTGEPFPFDYSATPEIEAEWLEIDAKYELLFRAFGTVSGMFSKDNQSRDLAIRRIEDLIQTELRHRAIMVRPSLSQLLEDRVLDQTPTSWPMPAATVPEEDRELVAV